MQQVDVPLTGPAFERALLLAREGIATVLLTGGHGWEAALEPVLTEMANDRQLGALAGLLLISIAANAAEAAADAELELDGDSEAADGPRALRAVALIDDIVQHLASAADGPA